MKKISYILKKVFGLILLSLVFNFSLPGQNIYTVTKTSDPDPFAHLYDYNDALCDTAMYGTLQWAIRKSNEYPDTNYIHFNIPGSGPFIIQLNNYLPALCQAVRIDGTTQPGYNYNNGPLIIIDGANIPYNSDCFNIIANSSVIKALLIKKFYISTGIMVWVPYAKIIDNIFQNVGGWDPAYYRAMGVYIAAPNCIIQGNIFGTDITGTGNYGSTSDAIYLQNQYQPADNCLIGGSGVNEANLIVNTLWPANAGITIINGKYNRISRNRIYNNTGKGISLVIYAGPTWWGNEAKPAPVIDSLTPTGVLLGTSEPGDIIEIFGSTGTQNANEYITTTTADGFGNWNAVMSNYNWAYFIATATDTANNTSELSNAYEIIIPPPMATCATATEIIITPVCIPQIYYGQTTDLWFKFVPDTANVELLVYYPTTAAAHIDKMYAYEGACDSLNLYAQTDNDTLYLYDLTPGNTYYLKLHAAQTGYFYICGQKGETIFIPPDYTVEPPASNGAYYVNKGQLIDTYNNLRPDIKYYSVNTSPEIYLTDTAISFVLAHIDTIAATTDTMQRVDMTLGGNSHLSRPYQREQATGYLNYYLGHCPQGVTNVKGYNRIIYPDVYPNINMHCYSNQNGVKFYFVIKPGGRVNEITLKFDGADAVNINGNGNLVIQTSIGSIEFDHAQCYKVNPAGNVVPMPNQGDYIQLSPTEIGFDVQQSAAPMPIIIMVDRGHISTQVPLTDNLYWCTYYGGSNSEKALDSHINDQNNLYVSGFTCSSNFPVYIGIQTTYGGWEDAVIVKFNAQRGREWATYYGGSMNDIAYGITTDELHNVYFTGTTQSTNFPKCSNCSGFYQPSLKGNYDAFIVKLKPDGTAPQLWATYFGGNAYDCGYAISYKNPYLYIVGESTTDPTPFNLDFPVKSVTGAYNQLEHGDKYSTISGSDVFIAKFNTDGNQIWTTFLGGEGNELPTGCVVDNNGNLFVTGTSWNIGCLTCTPVNGKFPLCDPGGGAYVHANAGKDDAFIAKFDITGALIWSTEYGEWNRDHNPFTEESTNCIAVDINGNIYVTGSTNCWPFPVYPENGAYNQASPNNNYIDWTDIFILKFTSNGNLLWATLYGGDYYDVATAIASDPIYNRIYIAGYTYSDSLMPLQQFYGLQNYYWQPNLAGSWDDFLIVLNENDTLEWATYLGGAGGDFIHSISVSPQLSGNTDIILAGGSSSANYPVRDIPGTSDYFVDTLSGAMDITIAEFALLPGAVGIKEESINENLQVYPNPSSESITVCLAPYQNKHAEIYIHDAIGKIVYSQSLNIVNERNNINISSLTDGLYIMKVKIDNKVFNYKLIKIKQK